MNVCISWEILWFGFYFNSSFLYPPECQKEPSVVKIFTRYQYHKCFWQNLICNYAFKLIETQGHSNMRSGLFFPTLPYSLFLLVRLSVRMSQNTAVAHKSLHYDPPHRAKRCSKIVIINITIIKHNAAIRKTSASEGREGPSQAGSKAQSRPERPQPWSRFSKGS